MQFKFISDFRVLWCGKCSCGMRRHQKLSLKNIKLVSIIKKVPATSLFGIVSIVIL